MDSKERNEFKELCTKHNIDYNKAINLKNKNSELTDEQILEICKQRETFKANCLTWED